MKELQLSPVSVAELQAHGLSWYTTQMQSSITHDHVQLVGAGGVLGSGRERAEQARALGEDRVCGSLRESWRGSRQDPYPSFTPEVPSFLPAYL